MKKTLKTSAARIYFGAALALGTAGVFAIAQPAFAAQGEKGGKSGATDSSKQSGGHETGESHDSGSEHSGSSGKHDSGAEGGHESGGDSGSAHEGGHGGKGGANKGGRKGGTGDYTRGSGHSGGVKGHVFDQQEEGHGETDANRGPHPGGNPAENESHDSGAEKQPH